MDLIDSLNNCPFCELKENSSSTGFIRLYNQKVSLNEVIFETTNFYIILDIAPVIDGHLLIVSKSHLLSISELQSESCTELTWIKKTLRNVLAEAYCKMIFFEHGSSCINKTTSCIDHAHLHVTPVFNDPSEIILKDYPFERIDNLFENVNIKMGPYLFFEDTAGNEYFFPSSHTPSQYFRKTISLIHNSYRPWNWRDYLIYSDLIKTKEILERSKIRITSFIEKYFKNNEMLFNAKIGSP